MGGFEVLRDVKRDNMQAIEDELAELLELPREGIPRKLWRALPDAEQQ